MLHPDGRIRAGVAEDAARAALVRRARRLLDGARARGIPVVSVGMAFRPEHTRLVANSPMFRAAVSSRALVAGSWGAEFHHRLRPRRGEPVVIHSRINAFYGSELELVLSSIRVRRLVVAGVATHSTVEHTARHAADAGYDVVVAADACAAADPDLHAASLRALALHVERVATVEEILTELDGAGA